MWRHVINVGVVVLFSCAHSRRRVQDVYKNTNKSNHIIRHITRPKIVCIT
jgi:hypothetical protein